MAKTGSYLGGSTVFPDWSSWTGKEDDNGKENDNSDFRVAPPDIEQLLERRKLVKKFGSSEELKKIDTVLRKVRSRGKK